MQVSFAPVRRTAIRLAALSLGVATTVVLTAAPSQAAGCPTATDLYQSGNSVIAYAENQCGLGFLLTLRRNGVEIRRTYSHAGVAQITYNCVGTALTHWSTGTGVSLDAYCS